MVSFNRLFFYVTNFNSMTFFSNRKLDQSQSPSKTNKTSNSLASFLLDDEPISLEIAHTVIDNVSYNEIILNNK